MEKNENNIMKILAIGLAVLIVIIVVGGGILLFMSGKRTTDSSEKVEKTELEEIMPNEAELKTRDKITVSVNSNKAENESESEDSDENDYILPESNQRLLTEADISGLSAKELNYAKNEIYARHGRKFKSEELQEYFDGKSWYEGIYEGDDFDQNYSESVLTDTEKKNAEFLSDAEKSMS